MIQTIITSIRQDLATFCPGAEFRVYKTAENFPCVHVQQLTGRDISFELENSIKNKHSSAVVYFK